MLTSIHFERIIRGHYVKKYDNKYLNLELHRVNKIKRFIYLEDEFFKLLEKDELKGKKALKEGRLN